MVTDHKPLVKIFGDRTLDEIANTRLFRLKQRTLPWHFRIVHMPGKINDAADAASRYPVLNTEVSSITYCDQEEFLIAAAISNETLDMTAISWDLLSLQTKKDQSHSRLIMAINENFKCNTEGIEDYIKY